MHLAREWEGNGIQDVVDWLFRAAAAEKDKEKTKELST